jgi:hypothetical protein
MTDREKSQRPKGLQTQQMMTQFVTKIKMSLVGGATTIYCQFVLYVHGQVCVWEQMDLLDFPAFLLCVHPPLPGFLHNLTSPLETWNDVYYPDHPVHVKRMPRLNHGDPFSNHPN